MNVVELGATPGKFSEQGYLICRNLFPPDLRAGVVQAVRAQLQPVLAPAEFEADVGYPGAPEHRGTSGGLTPRRLLAAYARFPALRDFVTSTAVRSELAAMLDSDDLRMSQAHHNCVMTKSPDHSSATLWHQDIRYWSFDRPDLVSMWIALGEENLRNGCLRVLPGSHRLELDRGRLDRDLFLRPELTENKPLLRTAVPVALNAGDVLFFHSRLFHAAGPNRTEEVKLSAVFTYHAADNQAIPGTRSAQYESIRFAGC